MRSLTPSKFIEWAVWYAEQYESNLTPIRIVKFLYLLDLYYARQSGGKTWTGWRWKFVHYGPFCGDALDAISAAESAGLIAGRIFSSKFDKDGKYYQYSGEDTPEEVPDLLPIYVSSEIRHAVKTWADDTYGLLNYVYFNTEPMMSAVPGQILDFSLAEMPSTEKPVEMIPLSKKKLRKANELLGKLRSAQLERAANKAALEEGIHDAAYFEALRSLEEKKDDIISFSGTLNLTS
jgi:hypothetical protein